MPGVRTEAVNTSSCVLNNPILDEFIEIDTGADSAILGKAILGSMILGKM